MDSPEQVTSPRERSIGTALVFLALAALVVLTNRFGSYYDDEIASIRLMEQAHDWRAVIALANSRDVHPPLGYLIDFALHTLTGDWKTVQLVAGLVNAGALAAFVWLAAQGLPRRTWRVLAFLAATAATQIMWGASLRWYAWFNPLFAVTLASLLWGQLSARSAAALIAVTGAALLHTSYLALIAVPLLGIVWCWRYRLALDRTTLLAAMLCGALALAVCLPQLLVFREVHLPGGEAQRGGLTLAFAQTATTVLLGNAVFPLAVLPALAGLALCSAILRLATSPQRWPPLAPVLAIVMTGSAVMALSGLGYKPRNSVFLNLACLPLLAAGLAALPLRWRIAALAIVGLFQLQGMRNVALHEDTSKRSFNTPYPELVAMIGSMSKNCLHTVVAHTDVVLAYLLDGRTVQSSPYDETMAQLRPGDCVIREEGTAFELPPDRVAQWKMSFNSAALRPEQVAQFREEAAAAWIGRRLGQPITPYAARLEKLRVTAPAMVPASQP